MSDQSRVLLVLVIVAFGISFLTLLSSLCAGKTIIVDDDAGEGGNGSLENPFRRIMQAVDHAGEGDIIIVRKGEYHEHVVVDRSIDLVGEGTGGTRNGEVRNGEGNGEVRIRGWGNGTVVSIKADGVNVSGFRITQGLIGIRIAGSNVTISGNDCSGNGSGILVEGGGNVTLVDNKCSGTTSSGIYLGNSRNSTIAGNTCNDNNPDAGIRVYQSRNVTVRGNTCNGNGYCGIVLQNSGYNILVNNSCTGNRDAGIVLDFSHWNEIRSSVSSENDNGIILSSSHDNILDKNDFQYNGESGVELEFSRRNVISSNNCSNNSYGVRVTNYSNDNDVDSNRCDGNDVCGISLWDLCEYNILQDNCCFRNGMDGICFHDSDLNEVLYNVLMDNNDSGMNITSSDSLTVIGNTCGGNTMGIQVRYGNDGHLEFNNCSGNSDTGIVILDADGIFLLNNTCLRNQETGIYLESKNLIITGNSILFNRLGFIVKQASGTVIQYNEIFGNREFGIKAETGMVLYDLTATYNWWGHTSGPYHPTLNPLARGDEISNRVDFIPWLLSGTKADLHTTLYVSSKASSGGDGSAEHPLLSVQIAITKARRGDTIRVFAGEYRERVSVNRMVSIIGNGSDSTVIDARGILDVVSITIEGVVFSGFRVRNGSKSSGYAGIKLYSDNNTITDVLCVNNGNGVYPKESSNNVFDGIVCTGNAFHGMTFGYVDSRWNVIRNSSFSGNEGSGVFLREADGNNFSGCSFRNNTGYGLYIHACKNTVVHESSFENNEFGLAFNTSSRIMVSGCRFTENLECGVLIDNSWESKIEANSFSRNKDGIRALGNYRDNLVQNNHFGNNSVYGVNATGCSHEVDARMNSWGNDSGPYHPTGNANGIGDRVSDNVLFDPWLSMSGDVNTIVDDGGEEDSEFFIMVGLLAILGFLVLLLGVLTVCVFVDLLPGNHGRIISPNKRFRR